MVVSWFRRGFKRIQADNDVDVRKLEDVGLTFPSPKPTCRNAFDIISLSSGFNLSRACSRMMWINDLLGKGRMIQIPKSNSQENLMRDSSGKLQNRWDSKPNEHSVITELRREVLMVQEFSRLVKSIRDTGGNPDPQWPAITKKTQILVNVVNTSIKEGLISVTL